MVGLTYFGLKWSVDLAKVLVLVGRDKNFPSQSFNLNLRKALQIRVMARMLSNLIDLKVFHERQISQRPLETDCVDCLNSNKYFFFYWLVSRVLITVWNTFFLWKLNNKDKVFHPCHYCKWVLCQHSVTACYTCNISWVMRDQKLFDKYVIRLLSAQIFTPLCHYILRNLGGCFQPDSSRSRGLEEAQDPTWQQPGQCWLVFGQSGNCRHQRRHYVSREDRKTAVICQFF